MTLTTNNTDYLPFLTYAKSAKAREAFWKLYRHARAPEEHGRCSAGCSRRATSWRDLLGFPTWADYITGDKMIGTRQSGERLHQTASPPRPTTRMTADYKALLARKQRDDAGRDVGRRLGQRATTRSR